MGNVMRVLKRDLLRLIKAPAALVVVAALLVLPSVYTWYNVVGFWDPYDNTGNLRVSVVNEDEGGASDLTGELHVGDMIVDELHENDQLHWVFSDYDTAMADLEAGRSYAVFVIPSDFTDRLLSLTTGDFQKPDIRYYVNEKLGPVAPKITDTGATTLDETINSTFVSTVSDVAVGAVDDALGDARETLDTSRSQAVLKLAEASKKVEEVRAALGDVREATEKAKDKAADAQGEIERVRGKLGDAESALSGISDKTERLQGDLTSLAGIAMPAASEGLAAVSGVSAKANAAAAEAESLMKDAETALNSGLSQGQTAVDEGRALAEHLRGAAQGLPEKDPLRASLLAAADKLSQANDSAQRQLDNVAAAAADAGETAQAVGTAAGSLDGAVIRTSTSLESCSETIFGTAVPALNEGLADAGSSAAALGTSVSNQRLLADQASLALDQLANVLDNAGDAVAQTDALLADLQGDLDSVRGDVLTLGTSGILEQLFDGQTLDASAVADFVGAPTELVTEQLYPLNAYGSAMAPLFMNLTFWIGAFMLLVIMKQEVDSEGIRNLTLAQRYLARFLFLAVLAVLQAVICCAGILVIGVQAMNVPALFAASSVASLAYLSIIYALSITLQHVGKGICIVLVFAQIPGATGLYPIEMTPSFFQTIYPMLPFTYGIGAMREAICGFYGSQYAHDLGMLLLYLAASMAFGILMRPVMANLNRMVAGQIREGDLFNGEDVELPARSWRFSQITRALSDREEYRAQLESRYARFERRYPWFIRGSIALGIAVPVVLSLVFALTTAEKVVVLTVLLALLVALLVFLMVIETLRYNFARQMDADSMDAETLLGQCSSRNEVERAGAQDARRSEAGGEGGVHA